METQTPKSKLRRAVVHWSFRVCLGVFLLLLTAFLFKDAIIKSIAERRLSAETGLVVRIGSMKVGLWSGSVDLKDLKVYSPPGFGNAPLLYVPETGCVFKLRAGKPRQLHFNELKFHLAELNAIRNKSGVLNLAVAQESILKALKKRKLQFDFGGIDRLELTLENVNYTDEQAP